MRNLEIKRILVPTDMSPNSTISLRYARFFVEHFSSALTLLYIDPIVVPVTGLGTEGVYAATLPEHVDALELEMRAYADTALQGVSYDVATVVGRPVPMIVREEHERATDLVIMATHGLSGWRRLILGSVTEGVLEGGDCPVLSLSRNEGRDDTPRRMKTILCPINFTDAARSSLEYASQLAGAFACELVVVHVVEEQDRMHAQAAEMDVRAWIEPFVQERCIYREIVLRGGAAERVLDCAEDLDADMIVTGAQHKRFRDEKGIGTTTERLVRFARIPVLSVPRRVEVKTETTRAETLVTQSG